MYKWCIWFLNTAVAHKYPLGNTVSSTQVHADTFWTPRWWLITSSFQDWNSLLLCMEWNNLFVVDLSSSVFIIVLRFTDCQSWIESVLHPHGEPKSDFYSIFEALSSVSCHSRIIIFFYELFFDSGFIWSDWFACTWPSLCVVITFATLSDSVCKLFWYISGPHCFQCWTLSLDGSLIWLVAIWLICCLSLPIPCL